MTESKAEQMAQQALKMAQQSLDYQEIQNVFGRHEYFHSAGMHKEELEMLWARKTPGVSFEAVDTGKHVGWDAVWKCYVEGRVARGKKHVAELREVNPDIEDDEKNYQVGLWGMHTLTTPVIEVAEDGQTAKGIWMSPGYLTFGSNGQFKSCWSWERYGVDFVKEDGRWKIWHCRVYNDFLTPYDKGWVEASLEPPPEIEDAEDFPKPNAEPSTPIYKPYSTTVPPQAEPRQPDHYKTFKDTFSY